MKREWYIICIIASAVLLFVWGLVMCQTARADHWEQNASLLPGTYMLVYINVEGTWQVEYYAAMAEAQGVDANLKIEYVIQGLVMTIGGDFNTEKMVEYLNNDPPTTKDHVPILFRMGALDEWLQVPLPCKWIDVGDGFVI